MSTADTPERRLGCNGAAEQLEELATCVAPTQSSCAKGKLLRSVPAAGAAQAARVSGNTREFSRIRGLKVDAYEAQLEPGCTRCHGEALSVADLALASHLIGVERFGVDLTEFPRTAAVGESLFALPEFAAAHPRLQLGAPGLGLPG